MLYLFILILDIYRETIPNNAPPSYRGQCIKYAYKITVGTQRVNAVIKLLKIPIRVLVLYGMYFVFNKFYKSRPKSIYFVYISLFYLTSFYTSILSTNILLYKYFSF